MRAPFVLLVMLMAAAPLAADQGESSLKDSVPATRTATRWGARGPFAEGTRVRMKTIDRKALTGTLLGAYALDHTYLRFCPSDANGCFGADSTRAVRVATDSLRELEIWGRSGTGAYTGALLGAGTGLVIVGTESEAAPLGMVLGLVTGMFVGSRIDRGSVGWAQVFPCYHGCPYAGSEVIP